MTRKIGLLIILLVVLSGAAFPLSLSIAQESPRDPRFGAVESFWDTQAAVEADVAWELSLIHI